MTSSYTKPRKDEEPLPASLCAITCRNCGIVAPEAWNTVPDAVVSGLNGRKSIKRLPKGTILFHEGDPVTALFRLLSGVVLLRKGDQDGNSVITRMVTPHATFGFRAFAAHDSHSVSAQCAGDAVVCIIPAEAAELAFANNRSLERAFAQHVAAELAYAEDAILAQMRLSVRERLLLLLEQMAVQFGRPRGDGAVEVPLPILRSDIAAMAGIARETFSRAMRGIEADGLLKFSGNCFCIPHPDGFHQAVAAIRDNRT